ncbi:MAG: cyclic nucleotide-binding domain-containing protein [Microcoleaceae cyanobacterium]
MSKALVILSELNHRDIDWMINHGIQEQIESGMILIHEGKPINALYIVLDGSLSVSVAAVGDREISRIGKGEVLGEMSFIDGRLPSATVKALTPTLVLSIPKHKLSEKLEQDVLFALRFYRAVTKFLSSRLRNTVNRFGDQSHSNSSSQTVLNPEDLEQFQDGISKFDWILQRLKTQANCDYHVKRV